MNEAQQPQYYLKGRSRHLFWGIMAYLILLPFLQEIASNTTFLQYERCDLLTNVIEHGLYTSIVFDGLWTIFMLLYGFNSNSKKYRIVFLILAGCYMLNLAKHLLEYNGFLENIRFVDYFPYAYSIISSLVPFCWVVCLSIMAFSKRTGTVLRIAAVLLGLYYLTQFAYVFTITTGTTDITFQFSGSSTAQNLYISSSTLFFAALSFTKPMQPKAPANPAIEPPAA